MPPKKKVYMNDLEAGNAWDTLKDVAGTIGHAAGDVAPYLPLLLGLGAKLQKLDERLTKYTDEKDIIASNSDIKPLPIHEHMNKDKVFDQDKYVYEVNRAKQAESNATGGVYKIAGRDNEIGGRDNEIGGVYKIAGRDNEIGGAMKIAGSARKGGVLKLAGKSGKGKAQGQSLLDNLRM